MMKILAIGNSFSEDATKFLHQIAKDGNMDVKVVNLYVPGCVLETHWENVIHSKADYEYQLNGLTVKMAAIKEALLEEEWDYVTFQQGSTDSGLPETYYPYLTDLAAYVKELVPNAKQIIHQTWSYEPYTVHDAFSKYDKNKKKMYDMICVAYNQAAEKLNVPLIPCGDVVQKLCSYKEFDAANGGQSLYAEDGYHMHGVYGRFATAATWYEFVLGGNILENNFIPETGVEVNSQLIDLIKHDVHEICSSVKMYSVKMK